MDIDGDAAFVDDLTLRDIEGAREEPKEVQADEWAEEALIPRAIWETSAARQQPTAMSVINLANALQVHPAIVAGKIRHEQRNFRLLSQLVKFGVTLAWRHRSLERNERRRNGRPRNGERRMELSVHESTPSLTTASGYPKAPAGVSRPS